MRLRIMELIRYRDREQGMEQGRGESLYAV